MDELHKSINPKILPKEYGGEVPLADMIGKCYIVIIIIIMLKEEQLSSVFTPSIIEICNLYSTYVK